MRDLSREYFKRSKPLLSLSLSVFIFCLCFARQKVLWKLGDFVRNLQQNLKTPKNIGSDRSVLHEIKKKEFESALSHGNELLPIRAHWSFSYPQSMIFNENYLAALLVSQLTPRSDSNA